MPWERVVTELPAIPGRSRAGRARLVVGALALAASWFGLVATGSEVTSWAIVAVGVLAFVGLLNASIRLRSHRSASFTNWQHDPFLAFAAALSLLVLPHLVATLDAEAFGELQPRLWMVSAAAALVAASGFVILIRDVAVGRALDSIFLAAIGALGAGLCTWAAILEWAGPAMSSHRPAYELLVPAGLDLFVLGLGLHAIHYRARARSGSVLVLVAWSLVLVGDVTRLLAEMAAGTPAAGPSGVSLLFALCVLGAASGHTEPSRAAEAVRSSLARLPRVQIALLGMSVLVGPTVVALGINEPSQRSLVVPLGALLSVLVVAYLVRLVQGRAKLEHRAHHDELTGLANRSLFQDRAEVAIAHARRTNGHSAVLFLDLDRFKNVNDSLGHAVGNLLLQAVARRLQSATRAEDTVARLGGDEFVVFLPQLDDPEEAAAVAAKILERFNEPFTLSSHRLFASPSIGIALFPNDGEDSDALLENADIAMYRAKQLGRKTFCTYDRSMNDHAHERLALESQLHSAIERGELRLHYQPKVQLSTGKVMGMEALLRWQHPELGLLQPSEFIPLAEECGLIRSVGEWALYEACRQTQEWMDAGFEPLVVAVNLSLRQFQHDRIADIVARVLRSTALNPKLLELEVTESLAMHDPEEICETLLDLRRLGVSCSIDDFGTGYSGLSHLIGFPIDKLKIDKSFVATIDSDREAPIVVAVVALAHGLGLEAVAEGVETSEQLERLRELGCDEMQGFFFSPPVPPERFEQLLMLESIAPGPGRLHRPTSSLRLISSEVG